MKTKISITVLLITIMLASCTPAATPIPSTFTPLPIVTVIPPTERPHVLLREDAALYSGPGNAGFKVIKTLKTGETVYPLGSYADFIQVEAIVDGNEVTGFIHKNALGNLQNSLPELKSDLVPWKPLYDPSCSPGVYDPAANTVTFINQGDGYYDTETKAIGLDAPLRIKLDKLSVTGASFGSIKILGIPDTQDPWWKGITRLDIANNKGHYQLGIRNGTSDGYQLSWDLPLQISEPIEIDFDQLEGRSLVVLDRNGSELKHIDLTQYLPDGLFPQELAYIGTSTSPHSSFIISGLSIGVTANGQWVDQPDIGPGLVELAQNHNLTLGTEFSISNNMDVRYCQTMKRDFNVAVLSEFSWKGIWLGPGQYDFSSLDREVDYAVQHGWRVRASHLVWGAVEWVIPDWLLKGSFTKDEYTHILEQHVKTLVERYKDRVQEWSVANEATSRSFYTGSDFWSDKIGPDYIGMAFRWAKEADPNSILIFNDVNNESPRDVNTSQIIEKMYNTVKTLKAGGVPIDVVGMQMHLFLPWNSKIAPRKDDVIATMHKFADLGVRIYITEFDVDLTRRTGTQTEKWEYEAKLYRDMLAACLESGVCDSFTTWGISDSTSWITCVDQGCQVKDPNGDPLMFDGEFMPKPAYFAVRDELLNFSKQGTP